MLQIIESASQDSEDVTQAVKAVGLDDQTSSLVMNTIRYDWHFGGPIKFCLANRHDRTTKTAAKLTGEKYQVQPRGETEEDEKTHFRLPPYWPPEVLFITGKAYVGLPMPDETTRGMYGPWQTVVAVLLQGVSEGSPYGGKGSSPVLRVIVDEIAGVYVDGSPITCASFADKVTHPLQRDRVQTLAGMLRHSALTSGLTFEDLDVRHLTPDRLVERCLSRKQNSYELRGQLPITYNPGRGRGSYDRYVTSLGWRAFASAFKKLVPGPCELCGNCSTLGRASQMEIHHLTYEGVVGRERDVPYALAKVCDRCHNLLEALKYEDQDSYYRLCLKCGC